MTPIRALFLSLLALLASAGALLSQSSSLVEEPGDVFFRAYMLASDAEKLMKAENYDRAIEKYSMAESVLDGLQRTNPTYQTEIVSSRKGKVKDALAEAPAQKKKAETAPPLPPPQAAPPPTRCLLRGECWRRRCDRVPSAASGPSRDGPRAGGRRRCTTGRVSGAYSSKENESGYPNG
jgi:hypothetical protein